MWMICKKEWQQFFSSVTGYLVLGIFLLITGLLLFVFPDTSLLNFGYANLNGFFNLMPWLLLFLVPAVTMRSISEEMRSGTFEVLQTLPLSSGQVIAGKYLGAWLIILVALLPTLIYACSIQALSVTGGIDQGATAGSYLSLCLLSGVYAAIGIYASSLAKNMIAAFGIGAFISFALFAGFDALSRLPLFAGGADYYIQVFGIKTHTASMSRGIIDSRDLIYFMALTGFFLYLTRIQVKKQHIQQ
ncbi:MAG TPA: ABC transporter permease subunit [Sediminibacterium sp.]|nr:ABC transporter permease subunit [Sediminibacterium sp.]